MSVRSAVLKPVWSHGYPWWLFRDPETSWAVDPNRVLVAGLPPRDTSWTRAGRQNGGELLPLDVQHRHWSVQEDPLGVVAEHRFPGR
jgi:hypothetical protein